MCINSTRARTRNKPQSTNHLIKQSPSNHEERTGLIDISEDFSPRRRRAVTQEPYFPIIPGHGNRMTCALRPPASRLYKSTLVTFYRDWFSKAPRPLRKSAASISRSERGRHVTDARKNERVFYSPVTIEDATARR